MFYQVLLRALLLFINKIDHDAKSWGLFLAVYFSLFILISLFIPLPFPYFLIELLGILGILFFLPDGFTLGVHHTYKRFTKNNKNMGMGQILLYGILIFGGYFISWSHRFLVSVLTKYYPFSHFFQDKLFHHHNLILKKFIERFEKFMSDTDYPVLIENGEWGTQLTKLTGEYGKNIKIENLEVIEKKINEKYPYVFFRSHKKGFEILVPTEFLI